ncbi:polymerase [Vesiculovirus radi]|uniref:RNA-directed RNA polymerase L n=2 Tax=Vesiculovirus radi TaxID=1972566 RepID=A0A0D3R2F8_9RHAB|nr:polymerase [Vesiculovirus radi]AJR28590.1 polymerase [Vesiculovirus radi]
MDNLELYERSWNEVEGEEFDRPGRFDKEDQSTVLSQFDYNLNSPLIKDDIENLILRYRGHPVGQLWVNKDWDDILGLLNWRNADPRGAGDLHGWFGEWIQSSNHPVSQGVEFLSRVDAEAEITFEVVKSFLLGWTGSKVSFSPKSGPVLSICETLCQKFLDLHKIVLIMNASTEEEKLTLTKTLGLKLKRKWISGKFVSVGRVWVSKGFCWLETQRLIMDRNFILMMKDVIIGRMQTLLAMINHTNPIWTPSNIMQLIKVYQIGDSILRELGNDAYDIIKCVEPICNLKIAEMAREFRPLIPEFPRFKYHIQDTVDKLSVKSKGIRDLYSHIMSISNIEMVLAVYGSFRHWGHPFINYIEGLKKLHEQVTMPKDIDKEYAEALASDLARLVLEQEFGRKKRWSVDPSLVPADHPFRNHILDNTWPTPVQIQDFGDQWHKLPLVQCFDIPDLIDPSIIYADKSHSMNKSEVLTHVKKYPNRVIPTRKVLQSMLDKPATNWLEFLEEVDKHGLCDDDLIIGLKGKERELKLIGRFFSLMSWKLREYFVITEHLIKTHFVPLFGGLTMADDLTSVIKKMLDSSSGQGLNDYSSVCLANHIDYEKWNNHQRKESNEPVFRVMGQFLGYPNLISRTHEFFEKSLIYYNGRPDLMKVVGNSLENRTAVRVCWNGQAGGLEGLRQKGWSILNLLVIQREAKIRNTSVKVLAQGDNQVICTQYKTRNHRSDLELKAALADIQSNNDAIMTAIERGTTKLGLVINQDETMQSADYLNYGKVPIFRGSIRGLEFKRWSRVTCVTNDQLPTCANLMASVSTNALTVAHFDTTPINAMTQFNYFGNFARLLLYMHDPAIKMSFHDSRFPHKGVFSYAFKVGMLYLDPSIGGVCGTALSRFLIRGFPDPVTESLSFWKVIYNHTSNLELKSLAVRFGNPKIALFRIDHIEKLLEDPTSLNISMGMSPANLLKTEIKKNLIEKRSRIANQIVRDSVFKVVRDDRNLNDLLWSIDPLFPRFLSEFKSGTFSGVASSIISLFQNSRTVRNMFKEYLSRELDSLVYRSELSSLEHLVSYGTRQDQMRIWECSAEQADYLRLLSWKRKCLGTTVPHPLEMHGRGCIKTILSDCCRVSRLDYISVHCPKGLCRVLDSRGPFPAYLGSKTSESTSIIQPWEKESKIPLIRRATRLRDAIHWFVSPSSNLARIINDNIRSLTGEDWSQSAEGFKRTGSALHRFSTSRMSHGGFASQSPASLTRLVATTDTMTEFNQDNYDFMFQASLLYSQMSTSVMLMNTECSNTLHFHVKCLKCIRKIEEPWLETSSGFRFEDVSTTLASWRNGAGSWGEMREQLKAMSGDWGSLSPVEKSYHVGRAIGFLFGDLTAQNSRHADDSSIFPLSIQKRLRGRSFLRGLLDGLMRASACQVIHRRSLSRIKRPANAVYGGLIHLIDKLSQSSAFINFCREGQIREELQSIPHKIPASYPTSNLDLGINIRNYLRYNCHRVSTGSYKSDISDIWVFSDLMSVGFAGPLGLSTKLLSALYKPSLSKRDRETIRKINNLSQLLRSNEELPVAYRSFLERKILCCDEEIRHACKFGIPQRVYEGSYPGWGDEASGKCYPIKLVFTSQDNAKSLSMPRRIQNPLISGLREAQLPTGAHYKLRSIIRSFGIKYNHFICGGDGSGGMTAALLRLNRYSLGVFNSLLDFSGSTMRGSAPDPPSALETLGGERVRCLNGEEVWEAPSDLSEQKTWDYFRQFKSDRNLRIDLMVFDMEVRELATSERIQRLLRNNIHSLLESSGTLIFKTYGTMIAQMPENVVNVIGPLFYETYLVQTEYSSSQTSEVYFVGRTLKGFVDSKSVDWADLSYHWTKLFCFRTAEEEYRRAKDISRADTLAGVPPEFLPDPLTMINTLLEIGGVPSGVAYNLSYDLHLLEAGGLTKAIVLMSMLSHFNINTIREHPVRPNPPSDGNLIRLASAMCGIGLWISIEYNDTRLYKTILRIIERSYPFRILSTEQHGKYKISWSSKEGQGIRKDVRVCDKMANIGQWMRILRRLRWEQSNLEREKVSTFLGKISGGLSLLYIRKSTGIFELLSGTISDDDRSGVYVTKETIDSDDWRD